VEEESRAPLDLDLNSLPPVDRASLEPTDNDSEMFLWAPGEAYFVQLPKHIPAPETFIIILKMELRRLLDAGRRPLSLAEESELIEPFRLDASSVDFCRILLRRVRLLRLKQRLNRKPFDVSWDSDKEWLYSIIWEYADSAEVGDGPDLI
jgi:hypothetical protein